VQITDFFSCNLSSLKYIGIWNKEKRGKNVLARFILNQYVSIGVKVCSGDKGILNISISDRTEF